MFFRLFVISFLLFPFFANAAVIYSYTGNNYTSFDNSDQVSGDYNSSQSVSGILQTNSRLITDDTSNMSGIFDDFSNEVTAYSFTDGRVTLNDQNSSIGTFNLLTNNVGDIELWELVVFNDLPDQAMVGDKANQISTAFDLDLVFTIGLINPPGFNLIDIEFAASETPGSWEINDSVAVPEPSTYMLLGLGLFGLTYSRRRNILKF